MLIDQLLKLSMTTLFFLFFQMLQNNQKVWKHLALSEVFETQSFSDLTIITNNGQVRAHSLVLCAASPLIRKSVLLSSYPTCECIETTAYLPDFTEEEVTEFLMFIYGIDVDMSEAVSQLLCLFQVQENTMETEESFYRDADVLPLTERTDSRLPMTEIKIEDDKEDYAEDSYQDDDFEWLPDEGGWQSGPNVPDCETILTEPSKNSDHEVFGQVHKTKRGRKNQDSNSSVKRVELSRPKVSSSGTFVCEAAGCNFASLDKISLATHIKCHDKMLCPECELIVTKVDASRHFQRCRKFECFDCRLKFSNQAESESHLSLYHSGQMIGPCQNCPFKFGKRDLMQEHESLCRLLEVKRREMSSISKRPLGEFCVTKKVPFPLDEARPDQCPFESCDFKSTNRSKLRNHYYARHCRQKCPHCEKVLSVYSMERHVAMVHTKKYNFVCHLCSAGFFNKHRLKYHMEEKHICEPKYTCDMCGLTFFSRNKLSAHKTKKHKDLRCDPCGKVYTAQESLIKHLKRYHDGRGIDQLFQDEHGNFKQNRVYSHKAKSQQPNTLHATIFDSSTIAAHIIDTS